MRVVRVVRDVLLVIMLVTLFGIMARVAVSIHRYNSPFPPATAPANPLDVQMCAETGSPLYCADVPK